jgi:hypothetical protein
VSPDFAQSVHRMSPCVNPSPLLDITDSGRASHYPVVVRFRVSETLR